MSRFLPAVALICGCLSPGYLPDGGRIRQQCSNGPTIIPVTVQDLMGQPVAGAQITAKNTTNGKVLSTSTNGGGVTNQVTDDLGDGQLEISATAGSLATKQPFIVQVACGECDCTAMPSTVTLTLQ
jgi:hypothetical protein